MGEKDDKTEDRVIVREDACIGCGVCASICPNDAIVPEFNPANKFAWHANQGGVPYKRGGRRNDMKSSTLDNMKFTRISMLTDPALDAEARAIIKSGQTGDAELPQA